MADWNKVSSADRMRNEDWPKGNRYTVNMVPYNSTGRWSFTTYQQAMERVKILERAGHACELIGPSGKAEYYTSFFHEKKYQESARAGIAEARSILN